MSRILRLYFRSDSQLARFLRFATVGVKVSIIDASLLYFLHLVFGINLYLARVFSLGTAMMVGYLLNRYFTFGKNRIGSFYKQMAGHFGVHGTGGLINYGIYSALIALGHQLWHDAIQLKALPLFAIWAGGMVGMTFNFIFSSRLVFHSRANQAGTQP